MSKLKSNTGTSTMDVESLTNYIDVNKIANSIEKVHHILNRVRRKHNTEAIATWEMILASLQMKWRDAMVEVQSNGKYNFQ